MNPGLGLEWSGQTDAEGRFEWRGAPTNALAFGVSAPGVGHRVVRLRATPEEHLITLSSAPSDVVRITGTVRDADTGRPVVSFRVENDERLLIQKPVVQQSEITAGRFSLT